MARTLAEPAAELPEVGMRLSVAGPGPKQTQTCGHLGLAPARLDDAPAPVAGTGPVVNGGMSQL